MKKVLQIVGSLRLGGLETVAVNCMKYADREKYCFDFVVFGESVGELEEEVEHYGGRIIHIEGPHKGYMFYYIELKKIIKEHGPYDIVHSHTYFNSALPMMVAKKSGVPCCIAHAHSIKREKDGLLKKRLIYGIMCQILNHYSDRFCACSEEAGEWVFGKDGFSKKGIILPNMIEIEKFAYNEDARLEIRTEFQIPLNEYVIGCVGRLVKGKNYHFLLDVFAAYRKNHQGILLIVGDGVLRDELEQYAEEKQLLEYIRFAGLRNDVDRILSAIDIFVMPSKHEGLGIVILEALANNLNCIVNRDAVVKAVKELEGCEVIDNWDIDSWVNLIIQNKEKSQSHSFKRIQKDLETYSKRNFEKKLSEIYM